MTTAPALRPSHPSARARCSRATWRRDLPAATASAIWWRNTSSTFRLGPPGSTTLVATPRNTGSDPFSDNLSLKLGENTHHLKKSLSRRRGRVDRLVKG